MSTLDINWKKQAYVMVMGALVSLVQFLTPIHALGQAPKWSVERNFDGEWWASASPDERVGFLYALDDCLTYDARPALVFGDTWVNYQREISDFYSLSSANLAIPVQTVFKRFGKNRSKRESAQLGERYGDEFWRSHSESARHGFVEGYFSCRSQFKDAPTWSRPLAFYVASLDDTYNVDDRHGENAPEYAGSVASALNKLRDH